MSRMGEAGDAAGASAHAKTAGAPAGAGADRVRAESASARALAEGLAGALRLPTVSLADRAAIDRGAFDALHAYLRDRFPRVHGALRRERMEGHALLYTWRGRDPEAAPLLLLAHQDVVPAPDEAAWTHPPFAGRIADGFVWGRGAIDDKSALLAQLEAVEALLAEGFRPRRTLLLALGHDEEIRGLEGAASLARALAARGQRPFLVLDEGLAVLEGILPLVEAPVAQIGLAEKGYATLELVARREGGHASQPPEETAIGILSAALMALERRPFPLRLCAPLRASLEALAPAMPPLPRWLLSHLGLTGPLVLRRLAGSPSALPALRTTLAPTLLRAGESENVLPAEARAALNARILPGDSVSGLLERVRSVVDDDRVEVRVREPVREPSAVSPAEGPAYEAVARAIRSTFPDALVAPGLVPVGTDSRHYEALGAPTYRFRPYRLRPEDLPRIHGVDERIAVADYAAMVRFYVALLRGAAGPVAA